MKMKTICLHKYEISIFCSCRGSNPGPWAHKTHALPTELHERKNSLHSGGFEPPKLYAAELKSAPFDHSGKNAYC